MNYSYQKDIFIVKVDVILGGLPIKERMSCLINNGTIKRSKDPLFFLLQLRFLYKTDLQISAA